MNREIVERLYDLIYTATLHAVHGGIDRRNEEDYERRQTIDDLLVALTREPDDE